MYFWWICQWTKKLSSRYYCDNLLHLIVKPKSKSQYKSKWVPSSKSKNKGLILWATHMTPCLTCLQKKFQVDINNNGERSIVYSKITNSVFIYEYYPDLDALDDCCYKKKVGGKTYTLLNVSLTPEEVESFQCLSPCKYVRNDDQRVFCFKSGGQESICTQSSPILPGKKIQKASLNCSDWSSKNNKVCLSVCLFQVCLELSFFMSLTL